MPTPSESSSSLHAADRQGDHVELAIEADTAIVSVIGDCDISNRDELGAALERAAQSRYVLVDFTRCTLLDSTGIAALLKARTRARNAAGDLRLIVPHNGAVARIAHLTRLEDLIPISQSLDEALDLARPF